MEPATPALIAASAVLITGVIDKLIEIWLPNSKINSIFDIVTTFITQMASAFSSPITKK